MDDAASSAGPGSLPERRATLNQLVAYNMAFFRQKAGMTQEELGRHLGGWTKVAVSAAERSWDGKRIRKFDADEIFAIASALGVPALALLLPPPDAGTAVDYVFVAGDTPTPAIGTASLLAQLLMVYSAADSPAMAAFHERVMALGASRNTFPLAEEALLLLTRARGAADEILTSGRVKAEQITSDARARAEALELDAIERHRQAVGALVEMREQLERRVEDLRDFEREYRSRLLAYLEGQVRDLKAGADDMDSGIPQVLARRSEQGDKS